MTRAHLEATDVWEYRAASEVIKWHHRKTIDEARADLFEVAVDPDARWVEQRRKAGEWEALSDD